MTPIELVKIDENVSGSKFVFGRGALKAIKELLSSDDVKDRTAVVISIAGAFRSGKSFLFCYLLKYLNHMFPNNENSSSKGESWLDDGNVPLKGFEWRSGHQRVTTGIQMWPEIFRASLPSGEKVAIILLDTQGLFDTVTTFEVNTKIFALSTMISSLNVLNLSQRIQEDNLQVLKFFTDYSIEAMKAERGTSEAPFGKLVFVVRDWAPSHEMPCGYQGGEKLKQQVLEIKEDQKPEQQSVRKMINSSFRDVSTFLMPHPGFKATEDPNFDGRLSDVREPFKDSLNELVPSLLSPENLIPKKIDGHKVTAAELFQYCAMYLNTMNSGEMPTPRSIFDANAEMSYHLAFEDAVCEYKRQMEVQCNQEHAVEKDVLSKHHEECQKSAHTRFSNYPKFHDNNKFAIQEARLNEEINRLYDSYCRSNQKKQDLHERRNRVPSMDPEMNRQNEERIRQLREEILRETERRQHETWDFERMVGRIFTLGIPYIYRRVFGN